MATRSNRTSRSNRANGRSSSTAKRSQKDPPDYSMIDPKEIEQAIDVYVDAPVVNVDEIKFELDDLRAHLAVLAEAGRFVELNVGAGVRLGKVELEIKGVETQALLQKISAKIRKYIVLRPEALIATALWTMTAWAAASSRPVTCMPTTISSTPVKR